MARSTYEILKANSLVNFTGTDLMVIDGISIMASDELIEADRILVMLCDRGSFSVEINGRRREIGKGDIIICPPGVTFGRFHDIEEAGMKMLGMSYAKLRSSFYSGQDFWAVMTFAKTNPVFHLSEKDMSLTLAYYNVIRQKIDTERDFYYNEIIQSLLECAVLEIGVIINRGISPAAEDIKMRRNDHIFKQFTELLISSGGTVRNVSYYAEKLCITPKHLSSVCKEITGSPALDLILDHAEAAIGHSMLYSDKTIKEIAVEYRFPDVSSFGKFFRSRFGMSPRMFRETERMPR